MEQEKINVREIFENAKNDPSLFSAIDIQALLQSIENKKNDYLDNKTMRDINSDVFSAIHDLGISKEHEKLVCEKLIGYRYVDEIHELFKGRHIRWIRMYDDEAHLTNGGIVVNVKFTDKGMQVLCKNPQHRFMQYMFDECLTFQKLSTEEELLLMAYENAK